MGEITVITPTANRLLFEVEGKPTTFGRSDERNYVAIFENRIEMIVNGLGGVYLRDDVWEILVIEPYMKGVERTTIIGVIYQGGPVRFELSEDTCPGLADQAVAALAGSWSHLAQEYDYPATVRWLVGCTALDQIAMERNPTRFGGEPKTPVSVESMREILSIDWGLKNRKELLAMVPRLYSGVTVKEFMARTSRAELLDRKQRSLLKRIAKRGGERTMWAWDLQRMIRMCTDGYIADWLSWEAALDHCLKAGQKLQTLYSSWDEFQECYLLAYCYWSGERFDDKGSQTAALRQIYDYYKTLLINPWQTTWDLSLAREW
ncbi:MAG: DUF1266 domain-containing protein [Propionibacteriaceae bacterium]|jgi:hypothetical protein|nr:DUF1266 domain-containing protein [Propionibacteriaceae bacterium]